MPKTPHAVEIQNDFGTVRWTAEKERAFLQLQKDAWTLQMTVGEFADLLAHSDRECPKCKAGEH